LLAFGIVLELADRFLNVLRGISHACLTCWPSCVSRCFPLRRAEVSGTKIPRGDFRGQHIVGRRIANSVVLESGLYDLEANVVTK